MKEKYFLTRETIELISEKIYTILTENKIDHRNVIKARLSLENVMLNWYNHFGEKAEIEFFSGKKYFKPYVSLRIEGDRYDPVRASGDDFERWSSGFIDSLKLAPYYSYRNGINTVNMTLYKQEINPIVKICIAFAVAIAIGLLGHIIPLEIRRGLLDLFITPTYNKFIGVLNFITVPFIFFSVLCGIYGLGDARDFSAIGKTIIKRYILLTTFVCVIAAIIFVPVFHIGFTDSAIDISPFAKGYQMILDIIPDNILKPFSEGNILQIILIAAVIAVTLLALGEKGKNAAGFFDDLDKGIIHLAGIVDKTIPFFIFLFIINRFWQGTIKDMLSAVKPFVVYVIFMITFFTLTIIYTSIKIKISPALFLKKMFPVLIIGLSTASSSAIHGENVNTCCKKYGINSRIVDFAIPLGMVICVPSTAVNFLVVTIYSALENNVEISPIWLITSVFMCIILSIASPPVAGGSIACYTLIFSQLAIPASGLAIAVTIDVFFDFIATTIDNAVIQTQLLLQTNKTGNLDRAVLTADNA